jgi:hypothetical protein
MIDTDNESIRMSVALVSSTTFICLLSSIPIPLAALLPILVAIVLAMQAQLFYTRSLAKSFWLRTYLRSDSPIKQWLLGSTFLLCLAYAGAVPLAAITYISVYSYDLWDCLAVAMGISAARYLHHKISAPINANLAEHLVELAHLRIYYWLAVFCVLIGLAVTAVAKGWLVDYSEATSNELATYTIDSIKHPVKIVQDLVRTLKYSELQLLRIRDIQGWPYGWLLYFFFLVPNALPALGLVTLYAGAERLLQQWIKHE